MNVVDLNSRKVEKLNEKAEHSWLDYFDFLSFSEIIDEVRLVINQLETDTFTDELGTKGKMLVNELGERVSETNFEAPVIFSEMKSNLQSSLNRIQK